MKGIIIFEDANPTFKNVYCIDLNNSDVTMNICPEAVYTLTGIRDAMKTASCNINDTYDFETGALISLMKMCGVDKVVRACNEAFSEDTFKTYATKYERELNELKKDFDKVKDLKDFYKKNYEDIKEHYGKLGDRNKYLIDDINKKLEYIKEKDEEFKELKSDKDKSWKNYQRKIQKKQDRINELNNIEEGYIKLREEYDSLFEEKEKLQHEYSLCLNSENALKCTVDLLNKSVDKLNKAIVGYKNDLYNTAKRCKELERGYKASNDDEAKLVEYYQREIKKLEAENEKLKDELRLKEDAINEWKQTLRERNEKIGDLVCENYKLKLDCEKLQHGYIDTDMIFCGGRACGKQYKALVELFKKIDQKKVDAAYKEAYNTEIPVWQKEFFKHMYDFTVYRKTEPIKHNDQLDSLLEASKYAIPYLQKINPDKPLTRREHKWDRIFKLHKVNDVIIEVKKEDVSTFLQEIENRIPEITWASGNKIFEAKGTIGDIYGELKTHNRIYFRLHINNLLSYSSDLNTYLFINLGIVSYLPPMRWDLFKKGRLAVKVDFYNYKEFYEACKKELGKRPLTNFACIFTVSICKDDGFFEIFTVEDQKKTGRKIVDWEDVR